MSTSGILHYRGDKRYCLKWYVPYRTMIEHCFVLWMIVNSIPRRESFAASTDAEATMTSDWLADDWSTEKVAEEIVTEDEGSGCICRLKRDHHIVCYGAATCRLFPSGVTLSRDVRDFRLKTTAIEKLSAGQLLGFDGVKRLDIDANFKLNEIEPGFFAGMTRVVNMSISFNTELTFLHELTFRGLNRLKRLRLVKNGFRNIVDATRALSPSLLPVMESLSLSENVFVEIGETSFASLVGTELTELDLILCQIERIHPRSFKPFRKLEKLRLGENILKEEELEDLFDNMAGDGIPVRLLNLCELGFRKGTKLTSLLNVVVRLNVTHLNLRRNHIESLYEGLFPYMPELRTLDLREVSAMAIEANALNQSLMPKLTTLLLGGNRLSGVMPGVLLPQLLDLDLSANSGIDLLPPYFDVNSNIFRNMTQLISLNLSFNRIAAIANTTFNGAHHLRVLGLKNTTLFYVGVSSFRMLPNLFLLNLEDNPFSPFNTFSDLIFDGLHRLEILLLSNCGITHFRRAEIFESLTVLRYLNLRGNALIRINPRLFTPLSCLAGLDLSSNQLTPWSKPLTLSRTTLNVLLLSHNRFTYLTGAMMNDFSGISRLDLSGNPYVCDGALLSAMRPWLSSRNLSRSAANLFDTSVCLSPDEWRDKPLVEFLARGETVKTPVKTSAEQYVALSVTISMIILCILFLIFYYRCHFRYWIFLAKSTLLRCKTQRGWNSQTPSMSYKYDAFVSYSHEDRNFVIRLVSKLEGEEPRLKLCVYERDFEIGTVISETVINNVNASRKIVFVVSDSFARSQWCIWELQMAEHHRIFFRCDDRRDCPDDSLIMIKLGPLADRLVSPILKYMLKTRIYLEWSSDCRKQNLFWDKLKKALSSDLSADRVGESR